MTDLVDQERQIRERVTRIYRERRERDLSVPGETIEEDLA